MSRPPDDRVRRLNVTCEINPNIGYLRNISAASSESFIVDVADDDKSELEFALIVVSHVNDEGLTRGSRNISKIADIRIDLTRDIKSSDPIIRRTTHLMIAKNRFCGRTGPAGQLLFDPAKYTVNEDLGYGLYAANDNRRIEEMAA